MLTALDLPSETTSQVLGYLSKRDLKAARLVCRTFVLLAQQFLFDTLYISPRTKDMEVFSAITQHPLLRASVRHLFFDSAHFVECSMEDYVRKLHEDLYGDINEYLRPPPEDDSDCGSEPESAKLDFGSEPEDAANETSSTASEISRLLLGLEYLSKDQCQFEPSVQGSLPPFIHEGFRLYSQMVQQQRNIHLSGGKWFDMVYEGLRSLGPVDCVSVRNSWDLIKSKEGWVDPNGLVHAQGSPVARTWSWCYLYPQAEDLGGTPASGFIFVKAVQLLTSASKQPRVLELGPYTKISPFDLLSSAWLDMTSSLATFDGIRVFDINLDIEVFDLRWFLTASKPELRLLRYLIQNQHPLTHLSIEIPLIHSATAECASFNIASLFPPIAHWRIKTLRHLSLEGVAASYKQLVGLLFLSLPSLTYLALHDIILADGCWADIIEGLLRQGTLNSFLSSRRFKCHGYPDDPCQEIDVVEEHGLQKLLPQLDMSNAASVLRMERLNRALRELEAMYGPLIEAGESRFT
ncbi:MAG: hypothetical protein Q9171_007274 [Xanthocarpia ochracea]